MNAFQNIVDPESVSDEQLVLLAREKNEEAFVHLASRCLPIFQKLSQQYRSLQTESEDLVQEGMLSLLSAVRTYRVGEGVAFRTYAYTCARNRMISALRHTADHEVLIPDGDEPYEDLPAEGADPAELVVQQETLESLYRRIQSVLSETEYQVFRLYAASYSYEEIARRLNLSAKSVDNALQRARRKLSHF